MADHPAAQSVLGVCGFRNPLMMVWKAGKNVGLPAGMPALPKRYTVSIVRRLACLLAVLGTPALLRAQATGTISGSVHDASGAVVPGAKVTATHTETSLTRIVSSDVAGQYAIPLLPVGSYQVRVEKEGFAPFLQTGISLQANTQVQADAVLQVRSSTEQVTVSSTASLVQTNSSTLVQVVDSRRVVDLPLNGRNVLQLVSLNAGVADRRVPVTLQGVNIGFGTYQNTVSMNGARGNSTNYLLDNSDHNEAQTNLARPFPNVDAVQEFSVQTSSFDAQYGRGVGGIVNVVTKSGTNEFHGTAFEFVRNFKLNAANFFSGRDALKRNQFGGTFGGPIRKDRTFFFASYQGTRVRTATPGAVRTAPSAAMKNGDFSEWLGSGGLGAIHDPRSPNTYFANNMIPKTRFDPVSAKILDTIPASNDPRYQVRFGTPTDKTDDNQLVVRGDHSLSGRHRVSARYFLFRYYNPPVMLPGNLLYASDGQRGDEHSIAANHTFTISPKWLNNLNAAYSTSAPDRLTSNDVDVSLQTLGSRVKTVPGVNLLGVTINGWSGISLGNAASNYTRSLHIANSTGYATGRHNLRFGGEARLYRTGFTSYFQTGGASTFTGQLLSDRSRQNAGNAYAEFLLGVVGSWRQVSVSRLGAINNLYSLFFQDDFRLTGNLTLNLGLRYDPKLGLDEADNQHTTFVPNQQSTVFPNAPRGLIFYGDRGVEKRVIPSDWNNLAPRVGLAWQFVPRTVLRAAYGIFYDEFMGLMYNRTIQGQPWVNDATLVGPLQLSNPYGSDPLLDPVSYKPERNLVLRDFSTYAVPTRDMRAGYLQNWNLVLERELRSSLLVRAAYVGSKGTHLLTTIENNPGIFGPSANPSNVNQRRIYDRIGPLQLGISNANSSYHSLQLTVQKRYSKGFSILANYTISKSIDYGSFASIEGNQAGPDPFNMRNNRGPSDFDVPQRFVVSAIWEMPRLAKWNPLVKAVLGGWQSNLIFTAERGTPLTIRSGVDNDFNGVGGDFADYLGGDWRLPSSRSKEEKIAQWFNKSVFRVNSVGTIGSGRRGQLRAPGEWDVDYSLFKNFDVTERVRLQFRGEFFNLFNHANLGDPGITANTPGFGIISGAGAPRIIQLALKVIF
jgi:outer membrane receptor protein involved in Fe transport